MGVATTPVSDPLCVVHMEKPEQAVGSRLTWARLWKEAEQGKVSDASTCWPAGSHSTIWIVNVLQTFPREWRKLRCLQAARRWQKWVNQIKCSTECMGAALRSCVKGTHSHTHAQQNAVTRACELPRKVEAPNLYFYRKILNFEDSFWEIRTLHRLYKICLVTIGPTGDH